MKKTVAFISIYLCLLVLFSAGLFLLFTPEKTEVLSQDENRMLQGFPQFSLSSLLNGDYMDAFESYLSDRFPARQQLVRCSDSFMRLFGEKTVNTAELLAAEVEAPIDSSQGSAAFSDPALTPSPPSSPETQVSSLSSDSPDEKDIPSGSFRYINSDGSTTVIEQYSGETLSYLAGVLNQYRDCLPDDGTVSFINAPISDYGNPVVRWHTHAGWEYDIDEIMQELVKDGVIIYDATEILAPAMDNRNLFSTEDHHWHVIAAWYAFRDMISALGYHPTEFYEYDYMLRNSLQRGAYTPEQLQSMTLEDEDLLIQQINSPVKTWLITHLTERTPSDVYDFRYHGYTIYLGGSKGPYRLFETGYHTGRNAFIIGDSYSFCLIPYLFPYYDRVLQTDYRNAIYKTSEVGASARQYIEEYDISDVYIITCDGSPLDGPLFSWRLETFLNTDYGKGA
ncbi:MAG: hypothetical protein J6P48_01365 [Oscillospiraceae bacterium]|nr:hypothetical protein [Oscillospiraceae bacterium]